MRTNRTQDHSRPLPAAPKKRRGEGRPRQQQALVSILDYRARRAAMLDREADYELALGHSAAAERLSWLATDLREDRA